MRLKIKLLLTIITTAIFVTVALVDISLKEMDVHFFDEFLYVAKIILGIANIVAYSIFAWVKTKD